MKALPFPETFVPKFYRPDVAWRLGPKYNIRKREGSEAITNFIKIFILLEERAIEERPRSLVNLWVKQNSTEEGESSPTMFTGIFPCFFFKSR